MSVGMRTEHTRIPTCLWTIMQTCTHTRVQGGMCAHTCAYIGSCVQEVDEHVNACVIALVCVRVSFVVCMCLCVCVWLACLCAYGRQRCVRLYCLCVMCEIVWPVCM